MKERKKRLGLPAKLGVLRKTPAFDAIFAPMFTSNTGASLAIAI